MNADACTNGIKEILEDYPASSETAIRRELAMRLTGDEGTNQVPSNLTRFLTWMETQGMIESSPNGKYSLKRKEDVGRKASPRNSRQTQRTT